MKTISTILIITLSLIAAGCSGNKAAATPIETFKTYIKAMKAKDITTMKLLLSSDTIKMHTQEAKAQGVTLDDIVKRETLVADGETRVEFRNEKIEGEKATLEIKNSFGEWETLPFVFEDNSWKIDKKGYADNIIKDIEKQQNDAFGTQPTDPMATPFDPTATPEIQP